MPHQPASPATSHLAARQTRRRGRFCAAFVLVACAQAWVQSPALDVERRGDRLHVSAPSLHFLEGKALERLRNGASVTYVLSVTLQSEGDGRSRSHVSEKVIFSYDLWEERFAVVQAAPPGRSASHLTAAGAEAWCLDLFDLPVPGGPPSTRFVVRLECSLPDQETGDAPSSLSLGTLIDVFSRKAPAAPPRWEASSRPLRLADLKTKAPS